MKGQGYRHGYLAVGVLAVSVVAFGWTQWAPARDANAPKADKQWLSEGEQGLTGQAVMEELHEQGLPEVVREDLNRHQVLHHAPAQLQNDEWMTTDAGRRIRVRNRVQAEPIAGAETFATGGMTVAGGTCDCDSECAGASVCSISGVPCTGAGMGDCVGAGNMCVPGVATQCRVAHCVGGICVQSNAPVDTVCNFPGEVPALFCTEDRCNDAGVCVATKASVGGAVGISPCSKQCCATSACAIGSFQNCFEAGNCPGTEGCHPKRQTDGGVTYVATCDEVLDRCFVDAVGGAVEAIGRCCTGAGPLMAGTCSETTQAACAGNWWRWRDPDDSAHTCNATMGCPKYSSGIAPVDDPAMQTSIGPIVPFARRCSIGQGLCEVNQDCMDRCNGGSRLNQACDTDLDCPMAQCLPIDLCVADSTECAVAGSFTSIGDDYSLANGAYLRLSELRFRGGVSEPKEVILFEIYDSSFAPPRLVDQFSFRFDNPGIFDYRLTVDCSPNCDLSQLPETFGEEEANDPPVIIPPNGFLVMRAGRVGNVLSPIDREFGEDDGNLFWQNSLSAPEVGVNSGTTMWFNGIVGDFPGLGLDVLAFDLVGEKLAQPPLAACCDPSMPGPPANNCTQRLEWDCQFCTNPARTPCVRGRDCGVDNEFQCTSQDWKGAKTRAQVNNDAYRDCTGRYCFNPADPNPNTLVPCTGGPGVPGTCAMGQTCESPCEVGTCCVAAGPNAGCNEVTTGAQCTALGGVAANVVFGQRCTPNCCPEPNTGVDCCKDYYSCSGNNAACTFRCTNLTCSITGAPCVNVPPGQGNCPMGNLCQANDPCTEDFECVAGATCTLTAQGDCPMGQTCDLECDGPNNGADPRIHEVNVPSFAIPIPQFVVNFQGITAPAVYFDDCALGGADFGWYEIFTIGKADPTDKCAEVTLNFCCSDPTISPVAAAVSRACPCAGGETIFADNNSLGQQAGFGAACNNDFCCTDNNFSVQWTMPDGTYVYGIVADKSCSNSTEACFQDSDCDQGAWCDRNNAAYQGHIIFKPCAPGACCGAPAGMVNPFCSVTDQFTCVNERKYCRTLPMSGIPTPCDDSSDCIPGDPCLAGVFLGDKEVMPVPNCAGDPCSDGACCVSPGDCQDAGGLGITFAACNAAGPNAVFLGGFLCNENPCPVCPIETQDQCQTATTGQFILPSDRIIGVRRADDFRPAGTSIRQICWFPCFIGVTASTQGFECNESTNMPPDSYIAKFYDDALGKPGALHGGLAHPPNGYMLVPQAKANSDEGGGSRCWRYTAQILPNLAVTPGDCMWIEVVGLGEQQANGLCLVHALSSADGNNYSMRDVNNNYQLSDFDKNDLAFCIDTGIQGASSPPLSQDGGCGNFPVACCRPGPQCIDGGTYTQCVGTTQAPVVGFPFPFITCPTLAGMGGCPIPANDSCSTADMPAQCMNQVSDPNLGVCSVSEGPPNTMEVCDMTINPGSNQKDCASSAATCQPRPANTDAYRCQFVTDNRLATTDGPSTTGGMGDSCFPSGVNSFQADIWYKYTSPCNGNMTIHSCGPNKTYDSMLQVYNNTADPAACVACPPMNNTQSLDCSDDNCGTNSSGSSVRVAVVTGGCYTIRYGGWSQLGDEADASQNVSGLDLGVVCNPIIAAVPAATAPAPHDRRKNRYISFLPNNGMTSVAFRVARTTAPAGSCWVQAPIIAAGNDQFTATCGANPVFRVWSEPVIHVGDCEIIPVVDYTIFTNSPGPQENPTGLAVPTILLPSINAKLWADNVGTFNGVSWSPPNQIGNVNDVLSLLAFISGAAGKPEFSVVNLQAISSADSCLNPQVNASDVLIVVQALAGASYGPPSTTKNVNFAQCAVAPSGGCPCCGN